MNCKISNISNFNKVPLSTLYYESVPGTTFTRSISIPVKHQYIKIKFNAVIVQSTTVFLQYQISSNGLSLFKTRQSTLITDPIIQIDCSRTIVQSLFFIEKSLTASANNITLEVRTLDSNAMFAISNIYIYYGSCHQTCKTCEGPTQKQCTSCQGLYMQIINGTCKTCQSSFYDAGKQCQPCPLHCQKCQVNKTSSKVFCKSCYSYAQLKQGQCSTNFSVLSLPTTLTFNESYGWISSQTTKNPLTFCGKYSLIGGISIGISGTNLYKTFNNLQVHSNINIVFTFFMIDQQVDEQNSYQLYIDNKLIQQKIFQIRAQNSLYTLSNECGISKPQMVLRMEYKNIPHTNRNITIKIISYKNFFGIPDFTLIIKNNTNITGCNQQKNGTCLSCINGFALQNNTCKKCLDGYYVKDQKCLICPIECQTCQMDINNKVKCTTCYKPLQLQNNQCKDVKNSIYLRQIIPNYQGIQTNNWILYPKLPLKGLTKCSNQIILGSSQIQYKFLNMKRQFNNLPQHRGMKIVFQFYQIDQYKNDSVKFIFNGKNITYTPKIQRRQICGQQKILDAVLRIQMEDLGHINQNSTLEIVVNGKINIGINNLIVFLYNCPSCNKNQVSFQMEAIPEYSLTTPPVKGMLVKLLFSQKVKNSSNFKDILSFSLNGSTSQQKRLLQGLIQLNQKLPVNDQKIISDTEYRALINLDKDYNDFNIVANPNNYWDLTSKQGPSKIVNTIPVSQKIPRYIDIDQTDVNDRRNIKNIKNLMQGISIFALWIGLASFIFGISSAFDDFFILVQVIFAHIFIQLAFHPPSFRLVLQGLQIVQFMAWLPIQARQAIQKGIIPSDMYQRSPIQFQYYWKDIVFIRGIYHVIIFLIIMIVIFLILKIFSNIAVQQKNKVKFYNHYFVKYYTQYQQNKFAYLDRIIRYIYFTVIWACALQFIKLSNLPSGFNIGNSIFCIIIFILFILYPLLGYMFLRRQSNTTSQATFLKKFEQIRITIESLYHFMIRYYKLLVIGLLIPLLYNVNPLATLIPLLILHLADGILILLLKPYGLIQQDRLNVCFYNYYPQVYWLTSAIQSFLFVILELLMIILYAIRSSASAQAYMHLGYACCVFVILLILNGLLRLAWGFAKIVQGCHSRSKQMKLLIQQKKLKNTQPNQQLMPMKTIKSSQINLNNWNTKSKLNSMRKKSYVSQIY